MGDVYRDAGARSHVGQRVTIRESTFVPSVRMPRPFFPSCTRDSREYTRAYTRVKFNNKAGKLWMECLPRVDNTYRELRTTFHSFFPNLTFETYFHDLLIFANLLILYRQEAYLPWNVVFVPQFFLEKFFDCSPNGTKYRNEISSRHALQFRWNPWKWNILINIPRKFLQKFFHHQSQLKFPTILLATTIRETRRREFYRLPRPHWRSLLVKQYPRKIGKKIPWNGSGLLQDSISQEMAFPANFPPSPRSDIPSLRGKIRGVNKRRGFYFRRVNRSRDESGICEASEVAGCTRVHPPECNACEAVSS